MSAMVRGIFFLTSTKKCQQKFQHLIDILRTRSGTYPFRQLRVHHEVVHVFFCPRQLELPGHDRHQQGGTTGPLCWIVGVKMLVGWIPVGCSWLVSVFRSTWSSGEGGGVLPKFRGPAWNFQVGHPEQHRFGGDILRSEKEQKREKEEKDGKAKHCMNNKQYLNLNFTLHVFVKIFACYKKYEWSVCCIYKYHFQTDYCSLKDDDGLFSLSVGDLLLLHC